jgi:superfamily II DNA helicase RecQ
MTVVVFPLISLVIDQADKLEANGLDKSDLVLLPRCGEG